jgi:hypothetical protein
MSPTGDNTPQRLQLMQHTRNIRFIRFTHNYTYAYTELNSPILVVLICRLNYTATLATPVCLSVRLSSVTETRSAPCSERATLTSRLEAEVNVERIAKSSVERRTTKNHRRPQPRTAAKNDEDPKNREPRRTQRRTTTNHEDPEFRLSSVFVGPARPWRPHALALSVC